MTRNTRISIAVGAVAVIGLGAAFMWPHDDDAQYLTAAVQKGAILDAVEATGTVNAVVTVQVGSQVSGTIQRLAVDFNSRVRKGDIIAEIDPSLIRGTVLQASADLENARANVSAAEANVAKEKALLAQTRALYERTATLEQQHLETRQTLELALANFDASRASVDAATATVAQARAQVSQRDAALAVANTNLDHTVIRSPIDGIVVARNVDVGQTVAASLQAPTVFTIAQDLTQMQVYAKTDESDVGRITVGQTVSFKVDAFPKDVFSGTVRQLRMNATIVQNVVTYDAIIDFRNPELKLFPGMTAYVTIPVAKADDVVKLPNAALRFKPPLSPETVQALYRKYGVDETGTAVGSRETGRARAGAVAERAIVWKSRVDGTLEPVALSLGITDHAYTEVRAVLQGAMRPGDEVVTTTVKSKLVGPGGPGAPVRR